MFDIEVLKEMKLSDLQEIAKVAKINKYRSLKKDDLVYMILDLQAAKPEVIKSDLAPESTAEKPKEKRARIVPKKEVSQAPKIKKDLFSKPLKDLPEEIIPVTTEKVEEEIKVTENRELALKRNEKLPRKEFKNKPAHDWSSHPADAFRTLGVGLTIPHNPSIRERYLKNYRRLSSRSWKLA